MKNNNARRKLENGPAKETIASSRIWFLKFLLSIGTGLAQPIRAKPEANAARGIMKVPIRSACLKGLRVNLPWFFAVLSPNLEASKA